MSIQKSDATKYIHTGNGEFCYKMNKSLTVPETFPIYLSSAYIFDAIEPIDKICEDVSEDGIDVYKRQIWHSMIGPQLRENL